MIKKFFKKSVSRGLNLTKINLFKTRDNVYSNDVISFDVCHKINVTDFYCKHKGKYTPDINI